MLKLKKRINPLIIAVTIFSLVLTYFTVPVSKAASIQNARDVISDSDVNARSVTHIFHFTTNYTMVASGYIDIVLPATITNLQSGNITCPAGLNASYGATTTTARCTNPGPGVWAASTTLIRVTGLDNPITAGSYTISVTHYNNSGVEQESADVMIAIIDDVTVSASVSSTLSFSITGLATSTDVNGWNTTGTASSTFLNFGTLVVGTSSVLGQSLSVATNAQDGFTVTARRLTLKIPTGISGSRQKTVRLRSEIPS
jgi:hypothetical protein